MRRPLAVLFLVSASVLPSIAYAQWQVNGVPISTEVDNQQVPAIASDAAGGAIMVWQDFRSGTFSDIYIQRVDALGFPLWTVGGAVLCDAANGQGSPAIVADGAGGALMAWIDARSGAADIYAQRVNASGIPQWTANGVPVCTAVNLQFLPRIISDGTGGAIITWEDGRNGGTFDIYAQRLNSEGLPKWTADGVALCTATNGQLAPVLAPDGAGGAIVTWYDYRAGGSPDIYAQRINDGGTVQWTADGVAVCTAADIQGTPSIMSDGVSGVFIAWFDQRAGTNGDIYLQRLNALGAPQWAVNGLALTSAPNYKYDPMLATDDAGGVIVAWYDSRGADYDVYAQRVTASGTPLWTAGGVAVCDKSGNQSYCTVVADGAGGAIVTWYDERNIESDIYAQRVNAFGTPQWTGNGVLLCGAPDYQFDPMIIADGASGAIVTWFDQRTGALDVYAQHIGAAGDVPSAVSGPTRGPSIIASGIYPNPLSGTAWMDVELIAPTTIHVEVYDVAGRTIRTMTLPDAVSSRRVEFDGRDDTGRLLPSGVYFCRLQANGETITRKMVIAR